MREYITPNWHVVVVHAPLGLLSMGILIELFCLLWRTATLKVAGRWMILLGAVASVPALTTGIYAYRDTLMPFNGVKDTFVDGDTWNKRLEEVTVPDRTSSEAVKQVDLPVFLKGPAGQALYEHLLYNAVATGGIFLSIMVFIACSDRWRRRLYLPLLLLLVASEGLMILGTHMGGLAVYEHGAAIKPATPPSTVQPTREEVIKRYVPPVQVHFWMAGAVVGIALIALALSLRAAVDWRAVDGVTTPLSPEIPARGSPGTTVTKTTSTAAGNVGVIADGASAVPLGERPRAVVTKTTSVSYATPATPDALAVPSPTSRFWLLAALATILTAVSGVWIMNTWKIDDLKAVIQGENRNLFHAVLGTSILVLTLLLAVLTRIARRSRIALSVVALLLVAALGLQVWVGVMLTFDSGKGPKPMTFVQQLTSPFRFKPAQVKAAEKDDDKSEKTEKSEPRETKTEATDKTTDKPADKPADKPEVKDSKPEPVVENKTDKPADKPVVKEEKPANPPAAEKPAPAEKPAVEEKKDDKPATPPADAKPEPKPADSEKDSK